ncbi:molybdenum cofactor biosynthesis protein MoaE [Arthrobacter sp. AET 35A]|uniref:molybdenum cofactor biosynthesis protein MoaE n=1 Tax=Arthrobacter sp. AET 35A TaxID=2292643 RepID=UPI001783E72F|nr:molybdenum cofactor biosynthesis protein MoaE [Arthrobacter sp. AET 35A]MBE0011710.1 molybdenum cofactor biosynthesis protein MoaE [Arthrobacter sp. AET 35A]
MNTSHVVHVSLAAGSISLDIALAEVDSPDCGAVVGFGGVVRNHDGGRDVTSLSYSAHPSAERIIAEIADAIAAKYEGVRIWVAHRIGPLAIGDPALVAAVASAHRGEAFAACSELVDTVKEKVPIWKEQFFTDGSVEWVGAGSTDTVGGTGAA